MSFRHDSLPGWRARLRDVRFWIWPVTLGLAAWLLREWSPGYAIWESQGSAPFSWRVVRPVEELILPALFMLASAVGVTRAWSGRSALNGFYFLVCALILLVSGALFWVRATYRLEVDDHRARVGIYGFYFRDIERADVKELRWQPARARGIVTWLPALVRHDGTRVMAQGPGAWEWAEEIRTRWGVPEVPKEERR